MSYEDPPHLVAAGAWTITIQERKRQSRLESHVYYDEESWVQLRLNGELVREWKVANWGSPDSMVAEFLLEEQELVTSLSERVAKLEEGMKALLELDKIRKGML